MLNNLRNKDKKTRFKGLGGFQNFKKSFFVAYLIIKYV